MYLKINNVKFLTFQGYKFTLIKNNIYVENGIIHHIGNLDIETKTVDLGRSVLIPCFFNIHSHLGESLFKDIKGDDWTLSKYLEYTESYNRKLNKEQREQKWVESAEYTSRLMKKNGISGFCAARSARIAKKYNLNTMSGYPIMNSIKLEDYKNAGLQGFIDYYKEYSSKCCSVGIFLHSIYANDDESFKLSYNCLEHGAEFISVHVSEDEDSMLAERKKYGMPAVELLDKYGLLNEKAVLVHCGYTTDKELELIAKRQASIAICPISNQFLNTKMPNLYRLEELNIPWFVATDGLATGRTLSLLLQIQRLKEEFPLITNQRLMESITRLPSKYFNRPCYKGNIETGSEAKFISVEYTGNNVEELLENLFCGKISFNCLEF